MSPSAEMEAVQPSSQSRTPPHTAEWSSVKMGLHLDWVGGGVFGQRVNEVHSFVHSNSIIDHLIYGRPHAFEKTLMLGKIEGGRRKG